MKNKLLLGTSGDAILLMCIKLVTIALGFAVTRLLSEYLSVYDYGTYSQILLVVSTVASITVLGMMDGVNYFYGSERDEKKRESCISTIFALQCMVSTVAGVVVLCLCKPLCAYFSNPDVRKLIAFAALLPLLQNLLGMMQILIVSVEKAKMLAFRNLVVSLLRLGAVFIVIAVARNVAVILWATVLLDVAQILFFYFVLRKNKCFILVKAVDPKLLGRILSFCAPMAVFTVVSALNRDLDKYIIARLTDTETLALYTNASKVLPFDIIMTSFCTVLIPQITRLIAGEEHKRATDLYKAFLEIAYISTTVLCCAALAASPQLMKLLYSNKYTEGLSVFRLYILVDMLRFTNMTLILSAAGKTKKLMAFSVGSLVLNAVLNVFLFYIAGIEGPAAATVVTTLLLGICILSSSARELNTTIGQFFDGRFLAQFALENVILMTVLYHVQRWLDKIDAHYFWVLVIICGAYALVMTLLHGKRFLRLLKQVNVYTV